MRSRNAAVSNMNLLLIGWEEPLWCLVSCFTTTQAANAKQTKVRDRQVRDMWQTDRWEIDRQGTDRWQTGEVRQRWTQRASSGDPWTPADWRRRSGLELQTPAEINILHHRSSAPTLTAGKGHTLTWPQAYMLLWVCDGFTLDSRKRAWRTTSSSSPP